MKGLIVIKNVQFIHQMVSRIQIYKLRIFFTKMNVVIYIYSPQQQISHQTSPKIVDSGIVKLSDELVKKTKQKVVKT